MTQPLKDVEATEEGRACFSCELSHKDEDIEWSLNGIPLYNDSFHEISHEGCLHTLVLKSVRQADAGTVRATSPKVSVSAQLVVRGEESCGVCGVSPPWAGTGSPHRLCRSSSKAGGVPESTG